MTPQPDDEPNNPWHQLARMRTERDALVHAVTLLERTCTELQAERDEAQQNCAVFCGENERLKKLLRQYRDIDPLYAVPSESLMDATDAALEGRDE